MYEQQRRIRRLEGRRTTATRKRTRNSWRIWGIGSSFECSVQIDEEDGESRAGRVECLLGAEGKTAGPGNYLYVRMGKPEGPRKGPSRAVALYEPADGAAQRVESA